MSTRVMARHGSLVTALAVASCLVACGRSDTGSRLRTPFDGLQLAQTSTLPDLTVGGEISANWFSRTSPLQGNVVVVESDLTWAPSGPTAVFLRASNLHLKPGVIINANGQDGGDFAVIAYGGGGAIWIATRTYDGGLVPDVIGGADANDGTAGTAGTARIFELTGEDALAERSFSDTW